MVGADPPLLDWRLGMETSIVRDRLIEAAILVNVPRPSLGPGSFKITVERIGIVITYIFEACGGTYSLDHIVSWSMLSHGVTNPLVAAMTGLLAAAKDYSP